MEGVPHTHHHPQLTLEEEFWSDWNQFEIMRLVTKFLLKYLSWMLKTLQLGLLNFRHNRLHLNGDADGNTSRQLEYLNKYDRILVRG